jgi:large subunit ribosomal protein L9
MASMMSVRRFEGLRVGAPAVQGRVAARPAAVARSPLRVVAQRAVKKTTSVVLTEQIPGVGSKGELVSVATGYFRNFLAPQGKAEIATAEILNAIADKIAQEEAAKRQQQAKAEAMATALATIGKFVVTKKVGDEGQIFGSVTTQEIVDAIAQQTGRELNKKDVTLPEIKSLGTYDAEIKLHPQVVGRFKVVVKKDTTGL